MASHHFSSEERHWAAIGSLSVAFLVFLVAGLIALTAPGEAATYSAQPMQVVVRSAPAVAVPIYEDDDAEPTPDLSAVVHVALNVPPPPMPEVETIEDIEIAAPAPAGGPGERPLATLPAPRWTPEQLQATLLRVPEVWLQNPAIPTVAKTGRAGGTLHPLLAIVDSRPDLAGLPMRRNSAQLSGPEADAVRDTSVVLRKALSGLIGAPETRNRRLRIQYDVLKAKPDVAARLLNQMLQVEPIALRMSLIAHLKTNRDPAAAKALAHRAVYEPTTQVREAALKALAARQQSEYMAVLRDAFHGQWEPAADLAADALTALNATDAVPELISMLDDRKPDAPPTTVRELVRVNHNRNCLLCHAQSVSRGDGVRVAVPNPVRPLPAPFSLDTYEGGGRGGSQVPRGTVFARPDITYLQQDFSWMLPVAAPGPWPTLQRYDFVSQTRPAKAGEKTALNTDTPQRRAVLRALQSLTGKNFGDRADDWRAGLAAAKKAE